MFIVQVASECAPVAKVGGLGDVVYGLSRELEIRGNSVELILPKYDCMRYDHIWGLQITYQDLWVPWYGGAIHCSVWFGFVHGRKCFFIEPHSSDNFFNRGGFYGYNDEPMRWAFFSKAALEFLYKSGKRPDIIHCHDWQTGMLPVMLFETYQHIGMHSCRVCYTIHNFKHQGQAGGNVLTATGLNRPDYFYAPERLRDPSHPSAINFMKAGIVYSNFVTTVSPRHAWEARFTDQGYGLGHSLHIHQGKFGGVLNGIDYDVWNPETDPYIPSTFSAETLDKKYANKDALRERLLLRKDFKPIVAFIGRLDPQKGIEQIRHSLYWCINNGAQFVLLGSSPSAEINNMFWGIKRQMNDNQDSHLEIGFNEELSHLIYAGADMIIVPSMFEPCGLTQMIGLRYGTVPVVREVGGLADTVFDRDYSDRPVEERNGYVYKHATNQGIESALHRAVGLWYAYPDEFRKLVANGMKQDLSWNNPGQHYVNIYNLIRHK